MAAEHTKTIACALVCLAAALPRAARGAELQARTIRAYEAYLEQARQAFLSRDLVHAPHGSDGDRVVSAAPGREDGIVSVPGGLVHHWISRGFIRGVTLRRVVDVSRAYAEYSRVYKSIIASRLLEQEGDTYRVLVRLKEGEAGVSAVLEIRSTVRYTSPADGRVLALSNADEIREVRNAGARSEQLLPAGRDSGYLWRANTFTRFVEQQDGVSVETETIGLSRRFPPLLGWIIEPIARRLGRKSVETALQELFAAVRRPSIARSPSRPGSTPRIYDTLSSAGSGCDPANASSADAGVSSSVPRASR